MSKQNQIPKNDPDLILARQYGEILLDKEQASPISDPLFEVLKNARDTHSRFANEFPVRGQSSGWERIQESIKEGEDSNTATIYTMPSVKKWYLAAAAVAIIVFSSILYIQQTSVSTPQLLAESGNSLSHIELDGGSSVTLRPNSSLYKLSFNDDSHAYSITGEALFDVEASTDRVFSVEAGAGRVVVTGTRFNVNDRNQESTVYLLEGAVTFESKDRNQVVHLTSGEAATIDSQNQLLEKITFETEQVTGWTQNRLTFRDREVSSIVSELEFHFNISIEVPAQTRNELLGGSITLEKAEQSLSDLGVVLDGNFVQIDDANYQFTPNE